MVTEIACNNGIKNNDPLFKKKIKKLKKPKIKK